MIAVARASRRLGFGTDTKASLLRLKRQIRTARCDLQRAIGNLRVAKPLERASKQMQDRDAATTASSRPTGRGSASKSVYHETLCIYMSRNEEHSCGFVDSGPPFSREINCLRVTAIRRCKTNSKESNGNRRTNEFQAWRFGATSDRRPLIALLQ